MQAINLQTISCTDLYESDLYEQVFTEIISNYNERNNRLNLFYNLPLWKDSRLELNLDYIHKSSDDNQAVKDTDKQRTNKFNIEYNGTL